MGLVYLATFTKKTKQNIHVSKIHQSHGWYGRCIPPILKKYLFFRETNKYPYQKKEVFETHLPNPSLDRILVTAVLVSHTIRSPEKRRDPKIAKKYTKK